MREWDNGCAGVMVRVGVVDGGFSMVITIISDVERG